MKDNMKPLIAFLGGAAIGAAVALLLAPEKGEVTRRKIGEALSEGKDRVVDAVGSGRERISDVIRAGREKLQGEITQAMEEEEKITKNMK